MTHRIAALVLSLLAALVPPTAEASDEIYTVIRNKGAIANKAFQAGDYAKASVEFAAVEKLLETIEGREKELAIVRFNLGRCYDELGESIKAIEVYRRSLSGPLDPSLAGPIEARIADLESKAMGVIMPRCAVPGAEIRVVGLDEVRQCDERFEGIIPGPHVVVARTPDGREQRAGVEVVAGQTHEVPVLASAATGQVNWPALGLTGAAVVSAGVGLVFHLEAFDTLDEANDLDVLYQMNGDDATRARRDAKDAEAQDRQTTAIVLYAVGGALAAGATYFWLTGTDDGSETALIPLIGPTSIGLGGTF